MESQNTVAITLLADGWVRNFLGGGEPGASIAWTLFSSPEPKAQGELLWSPTVRRRRPSVRPSVHNL